MPQPTSLEARLAALVPLSLYESLAKRSLIAFTYHLVSPDPPEYVRHIYPSKTPEEFERDLLYLKEHFNPASYSQLLDKHTGSNRLPPKACLLTVDDGYRECFSHIRPLLLQHGLPCIFFLATDFLDNRRLFYRNKFSLCAGALGRLPQGEVQDFLSSLRQSNGLNLVSRETALEWLRGLKETDEGMLDQACSLLGVDAEAILRDSRPYLTRDEASQLAADGFTLGAHSQRHVKFNLLSEEEMEAEIIGSCREVMDLTGLESVPFAFPFSGAGVDRGFLARLIEKYAFLDFFFDSRGVRSDSPFVIQRVGADSPPAPDSGESNLGALLHAAYQENLLWKRRYYTRRLRSSK